MKFIQELINNKVIMSDTVVMNEDDVIKMHKKHSLINNIVNQFYVDDMMNGKMSRNGVLSEGSGKFIGIGLSKFQRGECDSTVDTITVISIIYEDTIILDTLYANKQFVTKEMILNDVREMIRHKIDCYYKGL